MFKDLASKIIVILTLVSLVGAPYFYASEPNTVYASELSIAEDQKKVLEAELAKLEAEIAQKTAELNSQKGQSASISGDIKVLTTQIEKAKLNIKAKNLVISKLTSEINEKNNTITNLDDKLFKTKESLAQLIRKTHQIDDANFVHVMLTNATVSDFYNDVDTFASIQESIKSSVDEIKEVKGITVNEKEELRKKQDAELDAKAEIESAKRKVETSESEKQKLLSISKNKEKEYQAVLAERQKKAAQIRSALFALRDTGAIPFGDALKYAEAASLKTGVRPAFVLAILTQESNLGKNVGSCYLSDPVTGAGVGANTGTTILNVMKPTRDVTPFLNITKALGRDPYKTRVSCPWTVGYGGAMGPAQFIPSTWALFQSRIGAAVGKATPDPWNPADAFMASSIYLGDLGANAKTYTAERNAACRYYSGRSCDSASPANSFYGNQVMAKAATIQETMIDPLQGL